MEANSDAHYVSFLAGSEQNGSGRNVMPEEGTATLQQRVGAGIGRFSAANSGNENDRGQRRRSSNYGTNGGRTFVLSKLLRGRSSSKLVGVLVALAMGLLVFGVLLLRWGDREENSIEFDTEAAPPDQLWLWRESHFQQHFSLFQVQHGKEYLTDMEREKRYNIFKINLIYIHTHNQQGYSYTLKMNPFGDLTKDEFSTRYLGYKKSALTFPHLGEATELRSVHDTDLPGYVDWRERGCVSSVKDQGECGSCWAFSSTGAVEGSYCIKTGVLTELSQQQLIDCSHPQGNNGCQGGSMDDAFQYVMDNNGICSSDTYPYMMRDGLCRSTDCKVAATIQGYRDVPRQSEKALMAALALNGPVSVAIQANQSAFQFYSDGVFDASCGSNLDHGVLLVGYRADMGKDADFWILKNSWGAYWGRRGYMLLAMHKGPEGQCGVLLEPSFPVS